MLKRGFVVISRRSVRGVALMVAAAVVIAAVTMAFVFVDAWLVHRYLPDVDDIQWYWQYRMTPTSGSGDVAAFKWESQLDILRGIDG